MEIPLAGLQAFLIVVVAYWLMALNGNFGFLVGTVWLIQVSSASYAFLVGALVSDPQSAQEIAPAVLVPQFIFAGFFVSIQQIPPALRWIQYLCALKFALALGTVVEFSDICFPSEGSAPNETNLAVDIGCERIFTGNEVSPSDTFLYVCVLVAVFVVFRFATMAVLIYRAQHITT